MTAKVQLIITIEEGGKVRVDGPEDKILAYGMLEAARDSIQGYHAQKALKEAMAKQDGSGIVMPKVAMPRDIRGV